MTVEIATTAAPVDDVTATALISFRAFAAGYDHLAVGSSLDFRDDLYDATMTVTVERLRAVARALGKPDPSDDRWTVIGTIAARLGNEFGNAEYDAAAARAGQTTTVEANGRTYTLLLHSPSRVVVLNSRDEQTGWVDLIGEGRARLAGAPKSFTGADYQVIQTAAAALLAGER